MMNLFAIKPVNAGKAKWFFKAPAVFIFFFIIFLGSCANNSSDSKEYKPTYSSDTSNKQKVFLVGVHPLHNPQHLNEIYGPIIDYLNKNIPEAKFQLVASISYSDFENRLNKGYFHIAIPNPYQALVAIKHGYTVFGKMGDDEKFKGIILVRKDSVVNTLSDLKGKTISFPAPTALAATMMPLYYMQTHGLDVNHDIIRKFVGSQESSIMSVYLGKSIAAATWPPPWENFMKQKPEVAAQLYVKWETPSLVNNACVVRNDVNKAVVDKVAGLLFTLHDCAEGRKLLEAIPISKFEKASNDTYKPVAEFMKKYNTVIH